MLKSQEHWIKISLFSIFIMLLMGCSRKLKFWSYKLTNISETEFYFRGRDYNILEKNNDKIYGYHLNQDSTIDCFIFNNQKIEKYLFYPSLATDSIMETINNYHELSKTYLPSIEITFEKGKWVNEFMYVDHKDIFIYKLFFDKGRFKAFSIQQEEYFYLINNKDLLENYSERHKDYVPYYNIDLYLYDHNNVGGFKWDHHNNIHNQLDEFFEFKW